MYNRFRQTASPSVSFLESRLKTFLCSNICIKVRVSFLHTSLRFPRDPRSFIMVRSGKPAASSLPSIFSFFLISVLLV